ncbi:MAG: hypothetical protein WDW38_010065 [Sanguina aurantia]
MSTSLMKSQVGASIVQPRSVVSAFTPFAFSPDPVRGSAQRSASPFDTAGISPYFSALIISIDETGDNRLRTVSSGRHASSGSENAAVDICSSPTIAATSSRCSPAEESDHGAHIHQMGILAAPAHPPGQPPSLRRPASDTQATPQATATLSPLVPALTPSPVPPPVPPPPPPSTDPTPLPRHGSSRQPPQLITHPAPEA